MSEVRKLKITLVMAFLSIITAVTVPFSFFFNYELYIKIIVIAVFVLGFVFILFLIRWNKISAATQVTILYTLGLTIFYTGGTSSFYAYLFFYIALTIIIFYQELFSYLTYGLLVVAIGLYYIYVHQADLISLEDISGSMYVYMFILVAFYVIFFIQILYNEKLYIDLNYDWVMMNQMIAKYQENSLSYLTELDKRGKIQPAYEDVKYQKAVGEVAVFLAEQFREKGKEILNVRDLYLYIHERGLKRILDNDEFSVSTKKIANRLDKYLLNGRTEMISMIFNFYTKFRETAPYKENRYEYSLDRLAPARDEQIIALALIYQYLSNELSNHDEWVPMDKPLSHQEILNLLGSPEMEEFFSAEQVAFLNDNSTLFQKYLGRKS
jgi:signal transduction histidine kinase